MYESVANTDPEVSSCTRVQNAFIFTPTTLKMKVQLFSSVRGSKSNSK